MNGRTGGMTWWAARAESPRSSKASTVVLGLLHALLGVGYLWPSTGITIAALPPTPGGVSIVNTIDTNGPYWLVFFPLTAAALFAAVATGRLLPLAHQAGMVLMGAYAVAIWYGVFASEPNRAWLTGIGFTGLWAWHQLKVITYTDDLLKQRRRQ
jgi:hypothetical protein